MKESERRRVKVALRATGAAADVASLHQKDAAILSGARESVRGVEHQTFGLGHIAATTAG